MHNGVQKILAISMLRYGKDTGHGFNTLWWHGSMQPGSPIVPILLYTTQSHRHQTLPCAHAESRYTVCLPRKVSHASSPPRSTQSANSNLLARTELGCRAAAPAELGSDLTRALAGHGRTDFRLRVPAAPAACGARACALCWPRLDDVLRQLQPRPEAGDDARRCAQATFGRRACSCCAQLAPPAGRDRACK